MAEEKDLLEYYIKFPTPTPKDASSTISNENEEFVFVYDEDKLPVVMLLGWAGCKDKYLSKYSAIYEERGCITVRYTAPVECLFWRRGDMRQIGKRLVELIADMSLEEHPIFFHVFSNGGAFVYQHVSQALKERPGKLKVKGCIFDSAPGERRLMSLFRAIGAILEGPWWYTYPLSVVATVFLACLWFVEIMKQKWTSSDTHTDPFSLTEEQFKWPQLLLYSDEDQLIPAKDIEKFAKLRRQLGVSVSAVKFENSPHVKHFIVHRDVYISTVCSFLHQCLSEEEESKDEMKIEGRDKEKGSTIRTKSEHQN